MTSAINVFRPIDLPVCHNDLYLSVFYMTKASLIAIATVYGLCSGASTTLIKAPVATMAEMHDAGGRIGIGLPL